MDAIQGYRGRRSKQARTATINERTTSTVAITEPARAGWNAIAIRYIATQSNAPAIIVLNHVIRVPKKNSWRVFQQARNHRPQHWVKYGSFTIGAKCEGLRRSLRPIAVLLLLWCCRGRGRALARFTHSSCRGRCWRVNYRCCGS